NVELPLFASRASDMVVTWSDAIPTDRVGWELGIPSCVEVGAPLPAAVSDTGTLTIPANTFQVLDQVSEATCAVDLGLVVIRDFEPNPAFESSMVEAFLRTHVTFASMP